MTDTSFAQAEPVLGAIDIAKARHEVLIAVPGRKRRRRLTVLNQLDDFNRLIAALLDYRCSVGAAFEATGNYHHVPARSRWIRDKAVIFGNLGTLNRAVFAGG